MADSKRGRDEQARNEDRRQRERELAEAQERGDEPEPPENPDAVAPGPYSTADDEERTLGPLDDLLDSREYPVTTAELIEAYGDVRLESQEGWTTVEDVLAPIDDETYESAEAVRARVRERLGR